jgi:hypothetical protein
MDIEKVQFGQGSVYANPSDVFEDSSLTREQKIKVLRRWEYDARELAVAEEENMTGGPPNMLSEILHALHRLDADIDREKSAPNKQGGE